MRDIGNFQYLLREDNEDRDMNIHIGALPYAIQNFTITTLENLFNLNLSDITTD